MPCFKGLAVSIHSDGPLKEISTQKQARQSRISSYIAVPPAKVARDAHETRLEQPSFAISITLLTPGLNVPYSAPDATPDNPYPRPRMVGGLPGHTSERGRYDAVIPPYVPQTTSPNETIAAYIYFDGRPKEEVATLLRRGEETWVNSRWVSVPDSEGGGLAEREFLFREVGLERWLNGLDLEGSKDKAARIEKRQRKLEKKNRRKIKSEFKLEDDDTDVKIKREDMDGEDMMEDHADQSSDSDSDDEPPMPEAAGQIKVALFRVLASGEIKKGEYSPQFDAHDDDEGQNGNTNGGGDEDVDHTTSFAKPKSLDPKSISTQTVTGLDPPESPYAVFTFFYRGEKQLKKMGILETPDAEKTPASTKRKSSGPDFSNLGPLNKFGTVGFSGYRDSAGSKKKPKGKSSNDDAMDSDVEDNDDDQGAEQDDETEGKQENGRMLSPEDARRQGEIAEGVQKIKLKRQHSAEPVSEPSAKKSPHTYTSDSPSAGTPQSANSTTATAGTPPLDGKPANSTTDSSEMVGSPFKKARPSLPGMDGAMMSALNDVDPASNVAPQSHPNNNTENKQTNAEAMSDEEL
ncbi:hypothetical protein Q7P37_005189 [Cladosporium fusiforme]